MTESTRIVVNAEEQPDPTPTKVVVRQIEELNQDEVVAYHEAGHAAAHIYLGLPFDGVSIISDGSSLGSVEHPVIADPDNWDIDPDEKDILIDKHVIVTYAGPLVQERLTSKQELFGTGSDYRTLVDFALKRCLSDDEVNAYLAWMEFRTRNLVTMWWPQIEVIASALLEFKQLEANKVFEIVRGEFEV